MLSNNSVVLDPELIRNYSEKERHSKKTEFNFCQYIYPCGNAKGQKCGAKCKQDKCGKHNHDVCEYVYNNGEMKGDMCGSKSLKGTNRCLLHDCRPIPVEVINWQNEPDLPIIYNERGYIINNDRCKWIQTKGKRKGQECGKQCNAGKRLCYDHKTTKKCFFVKRNGETCGKSCRGSTCHRHSRSMF